MGGILASQQKTDGTQKAYECTTRCVITYWWTMITMGIIFISLILILSWLMCCFYFPSHVPHTPKKADIGKISGFFKITALVSITFAMISVIFDFWHICQGYIEKSYLHYHTFQECRACADFAMFASLLAFYIYLFMRLLKAFAGTIFQIGRRFRRGTIVLFIFVIILNLWYTVLVFTDFNDDLDHENYFYKNMHAWIWGMMTWVYLLLFVLVVLYFILKLRELTIYSYSISDYNDLYVETQISSTPPSPNLSPKSPNSPNADERLSREIEDKLNFRKRSNSKLGPELTDNGSFGVARAASIGSHPGTHIDQLIRIVTKQTNLSMIAFIIFMARYYYILQFAHITFFRALLFE